MNKLEDAFDEKVQKSNDGRWKWTASTNSDGYPKMKDGKKLRLASHISLELAGRKPPSKKQVVMHLNNDVLDMNPANLRVGTQRANLKQMRDEGRDRPRGVDQEPDVKTAQFQAFSAELQEIYAKR